ncbi:MAG: UDP-N-acetylmuramoyl-tripeptide--D-alanyl-D-alanine ligase [Coriobacteriales bacterium]|jgi:UDP-N-acetylmuramoyl-tripeptide--D-alanyl-D-alanine ligase|nr:UDP-N-acetylmuramoyl-tripeptide--D-alanyl-D-alanine ligase [Coriobacteriales bacterium]
MKLVLEEILARLRLVASATAASATAEVILSPQRPEQVVNNAVWDSRNIKPGDVFIAIKGEQVDGHDFIIPAIEAGASLVIASQSFSTNARQAAESSGAGLLISTDPEYLFGEIAGLWRQKLNCCVVGVTGSSGKSSTKELIASVLRQDFVTVANEGNFNNLLGLPATIIGADAHTEMLVLEMGMQYRGEIERYCQIARPHIAVYTNIGQAHMELVGSQEGIALAKSELISGLSPIMQNQPLIPGKPEFRLAGPQVVINGDDLWTERVLEFGQADERRFDVLKYGSVTDVQDIRLSATSLEFDSLGYPNFQLQLPDGQHATIKLQLQGKHNVYNALAAAGVGFLTGLSVAAIQAGLQSTQALSMRQQLIMLNDGTRVISDCYNANPDSMRAALSTLQSIKDDSLHIAVLGDMLELGPTENDLHFQIGEYVAQTGVHFLLTIGSRALGIAEGAISAGMSADQVFSTTEKIDAFGQLLPHLQARPVILIKASRSMSLDSLVECLQGATF